MADKQFHFANNKWDVTKNNNNKNKKTKTRENKERRKKKTNDNNKTQKYEQSLENSQNKL